MNPLYLGALVLVSGIGLYKTLTKDRRKVMADLQKQFDQFHDDIKLSGENDLLRKKRDTLKKNLEAALKDNDQAPTVDKYLLQGSYATYTGINPHRCLLLGNEKGKSTKVE